jgi:alpha-tubulin suppressor-like RCC1 family protein
VNPQCQSGTCTCEAIIVAWGSNTYGQLGTGNTNPELIPVPVDTTSMGSVQISHLAAGYYHSLAVTSTGNVYAWGVNSAGQLGTGNAGAGTEQLKPVLLSMLSGVRQLAAGSTHSLALTSTGDVYAWGGNSAGQLGVGDTIPRLVPSLISSLSDVIQITSSSSHSLALTSIGDVYAWGDNSAGQLGNGDILPRDAPFQISSLSGVIQIATGFYHSLALTSTGAIYAWGVNNLGQLGTGDINQRLVPFPVDMTSMFGVQQLAAGGYHSLALTSTGVWAWGGNYFGQLGNGESGSNTDKKKPVLASSINSIISNLPGVQITQLVGGQVYSFAVTSSGKIYTWGSNSGNASPPTPVDLDASATATFVATGYGHALAF